MPDDPVSLEIREMFLELEGQPSDIIVRAYEFKRTFRVKAESIAIAWDRGRLDGGKATKHKGAP